MSFNRSAFRHQESILGGRLVIAQTQATLFRKLLAETDARLRQAWAAGKLPADVMSADLIERTRAALAGEASSAQPSMAEIVAGAVEDLAQLGGHRL